MTQSVHIPSKAVHHLDSHVKAQIWPEGSIELMQLGSNKLPAEVKPIVISADCVQRDRHGQIEEEFQYAHLKKFGSAWLPSELKLDPKLPFDSEVKDILLSREANGVWISALHQVISSVARGISANIAGSTRSFGHQSKGMFFLLVTLPPWRSLIQKSEIFGPLTVKSMLA